MDDQGLSLEPSLDMALYSLVTFVIFLLIVGVVPAILSCIVSKKAGFPTALGLLSLLPMGFVVFLAVLAFVEWPSRRVVQEGDARRPE